MEFREMRVVADTHIIIWDALSPEKLNKNARRYLDQAHLSDGIIVCDISLWEIAMLMDKERLIIDSTYLEFIELIQWTKNYIFQPIVSEIADLSVNLLRKVNADPADRLISATSLYLDVPLITADNTIRTSKKVNTIW